MRSALQYARRGDGGLPRGLCFDVRDNVHDVGTVAGPILSSSAAVQAEYAGTGISVAPVQVSDSTAVVTNIQNTSSQTVNLLDPGALAAMSQATKDALAAGAQNVADASRTILEAFRTNTELAKQVQAGPVGMIAKILGWVAVVALAVWGFTKIKGKKHE